MGNPERGKFGAVEFNINHLFLNTPEIDFGDIGNPEQFFFKQVGIVFQFICRVAVTGQRQIDAVNIAEIIAHLGIPCSRR